MDRTNTCSLLRSVIIVEIVLFLLGGIFVTNMHPLWMQNSVFVIGCILLVTVLVWIVTCKR
ncbi:MAG: hypothetical protein ThorAB25_02980 [Candidatus Thorarchaeota archaeon AB_25]|nr:MAG: hypothetical protein ThorAB25_02980 [Candidatus Thorarchaeota archaeon AB_25]